MKSLPVSCYKRMMCDDVKALVWWWEFLMLSTILLKTKSTPLDLNRMGYTVW